MRILKINSKKPEKSIIQEAVKVIKNGGVVAYPTDTAYGLGCDPFSEQSIGKLFILKKRWQKPLPVIVANLSMLKSIAYCSEKELAVAKKYWPGALTIIFKKKEIVPPSLTLGLPTMGVRIPDATVSLALVKAFGKPITSTSANISGQDNCYSAECVDRQFMESEVKPDLIIDGGELPPVPVSTVIQIEDGKIKILREGPVKIKK